MGKIKKAFVGSVLVFGLIGVFSVAMADEDTSTPSHDGMEAPKGPTDRKGPQKSQAAQFKDFVAKNGLAAEKTAVKSVTKVTGADSTNNIADTAEVFTSLKGDIMSGDASTGKLIASAFSDWKNSKNGLVTVYNANGDILSNGNF